MTPPMDTARQKLLEAAFWMPSAQTMAARTSSITNAFVNSVIPIITPTAAEIEKALSILGMDPTDPRCAYCGDKATEWDHLRPLVLNQRPTGYISEIANLVPSCSKCNQSKGNKDWRKWIRGTQAKHSPTKRNVVDLELRILRLEAYEAWRQPTHVNFEQILGPERWQTYWNMWSAVIEELKHCQKEANELREVIGSALQQTSPPGRGRPG